MKLRQVAKLLPITLLLVAISWSISAHAVVFNLTYDDFGDNVVGTDNIVGAGTFSYDGPAAVGTFALSALSNVAFDATVNGEVFSTADILSDLDTTGISVFDAGAGRFGLVFTGNGAAAYGGSLDLENALEQFLTHEPTSGIGNAIGCCGGDGMVNRWAPNPQGQPGDYQGLTAAAVPEPLTLTLIGLGLAGLAFRRKAA